MSIKSAILGILSWKPSTGYEIKKIFEDSSFMHWSGNNNQIYKALLSMETEELVTSEVFHQDNSPSKKVYSITEDGLTELREWVKSTPEIPEIKKTFLVQFAWSDMLSNEELADILTKYEIEIKSQLLMQQEKNRRALHYPDRSSREIVIWKSISENIISGYINELNWIGETKQKLFQNVIVEEEKKMNYKMREKDSKKYIELISTSEPLSTENHALDLVALCWEQDTFLLMMDFAALAQDFFKLKTKVAGNFLQKFINYNIKTAVIMPQEIIKEGRFKEMVIETNKGNHFRIYESKEEAENWLLS